MIRGEDLIVVMRSLGTYPTIEEIKNYRDQYENGKGSILHMNQNSQNIPLINNSRTTGSTKILMLFCRSLDNLVIY